MASSLILCGHFCSGKTTLGRLCAEALQLPFYDTDQLIELHNDSNLTVSQIWTAHGDTFFRNLESEVIFSLKREPSIIATGGGSLLRMENREFLKQIGELVYLKASIPFLYQRLLKRGLPSYLDKHRPYAHFNEIAQTRFSIYEAHTHTMIDVEHTTQAEQIDLLRTLVNNSS